MNNALQEDLLKMKPRKRVVGTVQRKRSRWGGKSGGILRVGTVNIRQILNGMARKIRESFNYVQSSSMNAF